MKIETKKKPSKRLFYTVLGIGAIILSMIVLFCYGERLASRQSPIVHAAMNIKLETALAHQQFEKISLGKYKETYDRVFTHLDTASWYANALLIGNENENGVYYPIDELMPLKQLSLLIKQYSQLKGSTNTPPNAGVTTNSKTTERFHLFFKNAEAIAGQIEMQALKQKQSKLENYRLVGTGLFIFTAVILYYLGIYLISTERTHQQLERSLSDSKAFLLSLINTLPDLVWVKNKKGIYVACNSRTEDFFGKTKAEILGKTDQDLLPTVLAQEFRAGDKGVISSGHIELPDKLIIFPDKHEEWLSITKTCLYDNKDHLIGTLGVAHNITARKTAEDHAQFLATHDGLTSLYNHSELISILHKEIQRAKRYGHHLCLFMIDVDYFKRINDSLGHSIGDKALVLLAKTIKKTMRKTDINARYGGEEFTVILPETQAEQAIELAERLRKSIENITLTKGGDVFPITASIGIASFPNDGETTQILLDKADIALYAAKNAGRNQVVIYQKGMESGSE